MFEDLAALNKPIWIPDTCSLLDIIRSPYRTDIDEKIFSAAMAILDGVNSSEVGVVISGQVSKELQENTGQIEKKALKELNSFIRDLERIDVWAQNLIETYRNVELPDFEKCLSEAKLLMDTLVDSSIRFPSNEDIICRGYARMMAKRAPARLGKDSIKDCVVVESCLEIARQFRSLGHQEAIVFTSSNTNDFCSPSKVLHSDLKMEFKDLNIEYARSLHESVHRLGLNTAQR